MSRRGLAMVVCAQAAALIAVCLLVGDNGWDDGAITLAFSRTFARCGRIALTPRSEVVEGFSSVSWFLLNALPALARLSSLAAIAASQILSALCVCASTLLLARTCALLRLDRFFSTLSVVTFAAWGCSFAESSNGMEMGLLAVAFLVLVNELLLPRPRLALLALGVALAVLTRFEALLYVALLAVAAGAVAGRRAFWGMVLPALATVLLLSVWRLALFSDVLPNTFWAKRWPPYAEFDPAGRLAGALELPRFFVAPLVALVIVGRRGLDLATLVESRRRAIAILAAPIVGAVVMGAVVGRHWGYRGRMPYFAFPLALALLSLLFSSWVAAGATRRRAAIVAGLFACSLALSLASFPTGSIRAARAGGSFDVTPHTYAESGRVFREFATAADLPQASVLTPDVGGLALCCDEFRIVDLGLLSNRQLGHRGPAALAGVLAADSPELVEAHWKWASSPRLYDLPAFRDHYRPAFAGATKLWIRRDVGDAIVRNGRGCWMSESRADVQQALRAHRYAGHDLPEDRTSFDRPGVVLALDQVEPADLCGQRRGK